MLILSACQSNLFFAHKVWFYLKANLITVNNFVASKSIEMLSNVEKQVTQS